MITRDPRWIPMLALSTVIFGCADSKITAWSHDRALDPVQLDANEPASDYEFRICKDGVPTEQEASAEIRLRATASEATTPDADQVSVSQWANREAFEASEPPILITQGSVGDRIVGDMLADAPLTEPGSDCGPWSVFRIELLSPTEGTVVTVDGAFVVEFSDDAAPLQDFRVEMPDW